MDVRSAGISAETGKRGPMQDTNKRKIVDTLNRILEMELAGAVHYTHYSFMVYGYNRIPIVKWLEEQAVESMSHARAAGELVTQLGAHPSLAIGPLLETHKHDIGDILRESLSHEKATLVHYENLLKLVIGVDVMLEEYAREHIYLETQHIGEVDKMLRKPGDIEPFEKR
jgi:bacterioferritin